MKRWTGKFVCDLFWWILFGLCLILWLTSLNGNRQYLLEFIDFIFLVLLKFHFEIDFLGFILLIFVEFHWIDENKHFWAPELQKLRQDIFGVFCFTFFTTNDFSSRFRGTSMGGKLSFCFRAFVTFSTFKNLNRLNEPPGLCTKILHKMFKQGKNSNQL